MTKEINAHKEKDLPSQDVSADPDMNKAVGQFNKIRGITKEARGAPSRHQNQKIHILVLITMSMQKKPVTVIAGDSIIQHIRGWSISRSNKVVVKSFPGATIEDMEDFVKPLLRKKPDNVVLHIRTNDLNTQELDLQLKALSTWLFKLKVMHQKPIWQYRD